MPIRDYPQTVVEILDDRMRFNPAATRAVKAFAKSKPWQGDVEQRKEKMRKLNHDLAIAYDMREPDLVFGGLDGGSSGESHYIPLLHRIVMVGKLSVVTYLHEFSHARGRGELEACRWSVNLFRRCFPEQYARLVHRNHTLVRPTDLRPREDGR